MKVMVTGGAGYLGGVVVAQLIEQGHEVLVYDNLSRGERAAAPPAAEFFQGDLSNVDQLAHTLDAFAAEAVIHTAGLVVVGDSLMQPHGYFKSNIGGGLALIEAMSLLGLKRLVFTSSAAVYGEPATLPIKEDAPLRPLSPYGEAQLAFERMLPWYERADGIRHAILRCFNLGGATATSGADHPTRLIPTVLRAAAGHIERVPIYGEDYATPDHTCVRDFVHVIDAAAAHVLALGALEKGSCIYNVGYGNGYSVAEVVEMARQVTGKWIATEAAPRRAGDPAQLISNPDKIMLELGWQPRHSELDVIIGSSC